MKIKDRPQIMFVIFLYTETMLTHEDYACEFSKCKSYWPTSLLTVCGSSFVERGDFNYLTQTKGSSRQKKSDESEAFKFRLEF